MSTYTSFGSLERDSESAAWGETLAAAIGTPSKKAVRSPSVLVEDEATTPPASPRSERSQGVADAPQTPAVPPGREGPEDPLDAPWRQHLERPGSRGAAVSWVPNSAVKACMVCSRGFTLVRRRHHCRRCGACVCGKCSKGRVPLRLLPGQQARGPPPRHAPQTAESRPGEAPPPPRRPGVLSRIASGSYSFAATDTDLTYVRCCSRCTLVVDDELTQAIRRRSLATQRPARAPPNSMDSQHSDRSRSSTV